MPRPAAPRFLLEEKHAVNTEKETGGFAGHIVRHREPRPGEPVMYTCKNCGELFSARIPLFFDLGVKKCPKCGKFKAVRDDRWMY